MNSNRVQDVFVNLGGQDDNLGDSALRAGFLLAARGEGRRFHVLLEGKTSDYVSGLPLKPEDRVYTKASKWGAASRAAVRPVHLFEAGEINPRPGATYPKRGRVAGLQQAVAAGGAVIVAGIGIRSPQVAAETVTFHEVLRDAAIVSWRDQPSRDGAGFGDVAPDWAYSMGTPTSQWAPESERPLLPITMRFGRPWPEASWFDAIRALAEQTSTEIVTVAQVARDAPRAVRIAEELGGKYLVAASTSHHDLDVHVRDVYSRSLAVISDRAHGLIIGATEGAYPLGSAANPEKIKRLLESAGLGELTGPYDEFAQLAPQVVEHRANLAPAIDTSRATLTDLRERIHKAMDSVL
ncbi:hypothetical protein [Promicromonospora sp. NPDC023987]|uniref:hypothetical protein n=1 Tax=Promicromonospora sp. NPDC023987 TaxID=3155360 RepID=UPI0033F43ED3